MMQPLDKRLRTQLERTIKQARDIAESGAAAALGQLGVGEATPFDHLSDEEKSLRRLVAGCRAQLGASSLGPTSVSRHGADSQAAARYGLR